MYNNFIWYRIVWQVSATNARVTLWSNNELVGISIPLFSHLSMSEFRIDQIGSGIASLYIMILFGIEQYGKSLPQMLELLYGQIMNWWESQFLSHISIPMFRMD